MEDKPLHIELIKTMLQVNNDDARSLLCMAQYLLVSLYFFCAVTNFKSFITAFSRVSVSSGISSFINQIHFERTSFQHTDRAV